MTDSRRVLLVASTTGYQIRSFAEAAGRQRIEPVFATDRCHMLDDPWRDDAIAVRFHDEEESAAAIADALAKAPVHGVLAVGDRPTVVAARVAELVGLPGHPADAARTARNKLLTKERWRAAGVRIAPYRHVRVDQDPWALARDAEYPCVLKPVTQSASRGVIRADDPAEFVAAFERVRALLGRRDVRAERDSAGEDLLIERFIPGHEFAVEAVLARGALSVLAIFDKPDPLDGPFFEETIYVTPSRQPRAVQDAICAAVARAAAALGLHHGPLHAECRVHDGDVYMLEVAARPIGGLCARAVGFTATGDRGETAFLTLEDVLLRHAAGDPMSRFAREARASGVMMIPIPERGYYKGVQGVREAEQVPGVDEVYITAKRDQLLVPLPEGASYLGFIFARAGDPAAVERALRAAHGALRFRIQRQPAMI